MRTLSSHCILGFRAWLRMALPVLLASLFPAFHADALTLHHNDRPSSGISLARSLSVLQDATQADTIRYIAASAMQAAFPDKATDTVGFARSSTANTSHAGRRQEAGPGKHQVQATIVFGLVLGALGVVFLSNLVFWSLLKERLYLYYCVYLAFLTMHIVFSDGYAAGRLFAMQADWADYGASITACLKCAAAILFTSHALNLRHDLKGVWKIYRLLLLLLLGCLVIAVMGLSPLVAPSVAAIALLLAAMGIASSCYLAVRGHRTYLLYSAAFVALFVAQALMTWRILGISDPDGLALPLYFATTVLHVMLLNLAIANRVRVAECNYHREKRQALVVARQTERLLEKTVAERSIALNETNLALLHEIKQRTSLQEKMLSALETERQALARQRHFVSMASHEFRTPLAVIDASVQSLSLSAVGDEPTVKPRIEKISRAVERLTILIRNYLPEDKDAVAPRQIHRIPLSLQDIVQNTCAALSAEAAGRIVLEQATSPMSIWGDRHLLDIALSNLVRNALKYSVVPHPVYVKTRQSGDTAEIEVQDQGPGIADADRPYIFDKYYRPAASRQSSGSGLGLHLAREIARWHNGDVVLTATSARGSVFCLRLPVHQAPM